MARNYVVEENIGNVTRDNIKSAASCGAAMAESPHAPTDNTKNEEVVGAIDVMSQAPANIHYYMNYTVQSWFLTACLGSLLLVRS